MKLKLLATALIALIASLAAPAETFEVGGKSRTSMDEGPRVVTPFNPYHDYAVSQTLYTADQLSNVFELNSDGSKTTIKINKLSVDCFINGNICSDDVDADCYVYICNTEKTAFDLSSNGENYKWMDFSKANSGHGAIKIMDLYNYPDDVCTFEFSLTEPFIYEGNSILITWITETNYALDNSLDYFYGFKTGENKHIYTNSNSVSSTDAILNSGEAASKSTFSPCATFTYEPYTIEAPAAEEVRGEHTTFEFNWNMGGNGEETTGQMIPFDPRESGSYCQTLYTAKELFGLNSANVVAEIDEITFKINSGSDMFTGSFNTTIFVQNVESSSFDVKNGKLQWMKPDYNISSSVNSEEWYYTEMLDEELEYTFKFVPPFRYDGNSLLITWVTESDVDGLSNEFFHPQVIKVDTFQSGVAKSTAEQSGDLTAKTTELPVLKIGYTPITIASSKTIVNFDNVELKLEQLSLDKSVNGLKDFSKANNISVNFDLDDASNCGEYEILVNNKSVGTLHSTSGTINFLPVDIKTGKFSDVLLEVKPIGNDVVGNRYSISKDEIEALFIEPTIEQEKFIFYTEYTIHESTSADISAAVVLNVNVSGAAKISVNSKQTNHDFKQYTVIGNHGNNYNAPREGLSEYLYPVNGDGYDLCSTEGKFGYFKNDYAQNVPVENGKLNFDGNWKLKINDIYVKYPIIYKEIALVEGRNPFTPESESFDIANSGYSIYSKDIKYNSGSYPYDQFAVSANAKTDIIKNYTHPEDFLTRHDKENHRASFFAPKGYVMYWSFGNDDAPVSVVKRVEGYDPAGHITNWDTEGEPYLTVNYEDGDDLYLKAENAEGDKAFSEHIHLTDEFGVSSITSAEVEAAAGEVEFFNLQGVRVDNPTSGLYIRRANGRAEKVLVK